MISMLGRLKFLEIYEFSNEPTLFSCQNRANHKYVAVWVDTSTWMYAAISDHRLQAFKNGKVSYRDLFLKAEDDMVLICWLESPDDKWTTIEPRAIADVNPEWLAEGEDYFDGTMPEVIWGEVDQRR